MRMIRCWKTYFIVKDCRNLFCCGAFVWFWFCFQRLGGDMIVSYKCVLAKLSVKLVSSVI